MLTARDDEADVLVGLAVGADDYLTKPFRMRELVARVRALLRRVERAAELAARPPTRLVVGDLVVETGPRRVTVGGVEVRLTPTEFDLLARLAAVPGEVLSRERLLADVWDWPAASGTRTVDSHVKALRAKVGADRVRTVHGVGYALEVGHVSSPLATVGSIKVKLGLLVVASVVVAMVIGIVAVRLGRPPAPRLPGHRGARAGRDPAAGRRHDLTAARDDRGHPPDGQGRLPRSRQVRVVRRGRRAGPRVQPDGGRAGHRRSRAARPGRHRLPRAADAVGRTHRRAGEPRRRSRRADENHLDRRGRPGRAGSATWSETCSSCPVSTPASPRCALPRSRSRRSSTKSWPTWCRRAGARRFRRRASADGLDAGPTEPGCGSWSSTCSTTPSGTVPNEASSGSPRRGRPVAPRRRRRRAGSARPRTENVPSSGSARSPATAARRRAAPAWAWPSPGGWPTLHGGTVRFVDPPPGKTGAVLRVDLPLPPPSDLAGRPGRSPHPETAMSHPPRQPCSRRPVATPPSRPTLLFGRHWPDVAGSGRPVRARRSRRRAARWPGAALPRHGPRAVPGPGGRWRHRLLGGQASAGPVHPCLRGRWPRSVSCPCCCSPPSGSASSVCWPAARRWWPA